MGREVAEVVAKLVSQPANCPAHESRLLNIVMPMSVVIHWVEVTHTLVSILVFCARH